MLAGRVPSSPALQSPPSETKHSEWTLAMSLRPDRCLHAGGCEGAAQAAATGDLSG